MIVISGRYNAERVVENSRWLSFLRTDKKIVRDRWKPRSLCAAFMVKWSRLRSPGISIICTFQLRNSLTFRIFGEIICWLIHDTSTCICAKYSLILNKSPVTRASAREDSATKYDVQRMPRNETYKPNDFRRARIFHGCRTAPLDFVVSIREKRRGTLAASVIALVYRRRVLDDVYVRVHRHSGWLIYETCIDRRAVCIRQRARKRGRPSRRRSGECEGVRPSL